MSPSWHPVPILVTWDVDPDAWVETAKRVWTLETTVALCNELGIRATFFVTAKPADIYAASLPALLDAGHEIGCHGWTHQDEEDYDRMPESTQREYIGNATSKLQDLVQRPIRVFRSPRVKTSACTMRLLAEHGYVADSTVCSQRMDLISSNLINPRWLAAPRRPYRPRFDNAYRAGHLPLWEIPVSALMLPFISSTYRVVGTLAMKVFFRVLHIESKLTGKPIVYLAHPGEFRNRKSGAQSRFQEYVRAEYFSPAFIRTHGFRPRNLLYRVNGDRLLSSTRNLFRYMASFPDVVFLTVSEYVEQYLSKPIV